jgi:hypothetical protein
LGPSQFFESGLDIEADRAGRSACRLQNTAHEGPVVRVTIHLTNECTVIAACDRHDASRRGLLCGEGQCNTAAPALPEKDSLSWVDPGGPSAFTR